MEPFINCCPFCGDIPDYWEGQPEGQPRQIAQIQCINDQCFVQPTFTLSEELRFREQLKRKIVSQWNIRPKTKASQ